MIPEQKSEGEATELERGLAYLSSIQSPGGYIMGDVIWCPIMTAQYILTAAMTGKKIEAARRDKFLRHFQSTQLPDGSWGIHPESEGYVFVTTVIYVALRVLGQGPKDTICQQALAWIKAKGGVEAIPSWGKLWLAMMNLYSYDGINPVLPEIWLLPDAFPFHPRRMYCHTRLIYLGFSYLYGVRFQTPVTPLIEELRRELYDRPYESIDFSRYRNSLAPTDLYAKPNWILRVLYRVALSYEKHHSPKRRRRALGRVLDLIVYNQRESQYAALSPVNALLNILALHHAAHPDFEASFHGVDYWSWQDEAAGERFHGAHSSTWDTAFAVQAIGEGPLAEEFAPFLNKAAAYLKRCQIKEEAPDRARYYQDIRLGGFCFSDEHHQWPVSDCTAEALSALCLLQGRVAPEFMLEPPRLVEAVHFILSRKNADGGWGSYEQRRGGKIFGFLNPSEMFDRCMVELSYVECTSSSITALQHTLKHFPNLLSKSDLHEVEKAIRLGKKFLRRSQNKDGSWTGFWGVHHIYGTWFGVTGLLATGVSREDPAIQRACRWLVENRLKDGGWGESWRGCLQNRSIPHKKSQVIMTSWALITLLKAAYQGPGAQEAIETGIQLLKKRQLPNGDWPKEGVAGVFFSTSMLHYCLYKNYFPIWALGLYEGASSGSGFSSMKEKERGKNSRLAT